MKDARDYAVLSLLLLGASCVAWRAQPEEASPSAQQTTQAAIGPVDPLGSSLVNPLAGLGEPSGGSTEPVALGRELRDRRPVTAELLGPSLDYLQRDGLAWMRGESELNRNNGCISCHVVAFTLWGHRAVETATAAAPSSATDDLFAEAMDFIARPGVGRAATWSQLLLAASKDDRERYDWSEAVYGLIASQEEDGRWRARGQFPDQRRPERESDGVATMWALLALDTVSDRPDLADDAMVEAYRWLAEQPESASSEWRAMRLLVEQRLGDPDRAADRVQRFLEAQHEDGGWSWLVDRAEPSDAYSTGVALYALRQAGLEATHPAVSAAVDYLLDTRPESGIWTVASELTSAGPSPEKDYIYEYWGTAWAVIGLAEIVDS